MKLLSYEDPITCKGVWHPQIKGALGMSPNYIQWWSFCFLVQENVEYSFVVIIPRSTQMWIDKICKDPIYVLIHFRFKNMSIISEHLILYNFV